MNTILQKRIEEAADEYQNLVIEETKCHHNHTMTYAQGYEDARLLVKPTFIDAADWVLRNQWISVEEALPTERDEEDEQYSTNVFVRTKDCIRYAYYDFYNESWCSVEGSYRFGGDVTHWMPIPSLKGGEK